MDNTGLSAFIPLVTAIFTEAIQILAEFIKAGSLREMKWWRAMIVTAAVAIVAIAFIFVIISNATQCAVEKLGWVPYSDDGSGSTITVTPDMGSNCDFEVSFELKKEGTYVATYKKVDKKLLAWWIKGIEFFYSGTGNPNTMEFKLFDTASSQCKVVLGHATDTGGKTVPVSIPYGLLTNPVDGEICDLDGFDLNRMDFTFSSWQGDTPGTGIVIISNIRVVPSWKIWLIIFSPILLIAMIVAYLLWQKRIKNRSSKSFSSR